MNDPAAIVLVPYTRFLECRERRRRIRFAIAGQNAPAAPEAMSVAAAEPDDDGPVLAKAVQMPIPS